MRDERLLHAWVHPERVDMFLEQYWTRAPFWGAPDPARVQCVHDVLHDGDVPHLLEYAADPIRVWYRDGDRPVYSWRLGRRDALHAHRAGLTLYFHLDRAVSEPLIDRLSRDLARPPSAFKVSVFAGRAGARTAPHVDGHDNLTLHLRGHKQWKVSAGREWPGLAEAGPARRPHRVRREPEDWDDVPAIAMVPGAFLYCPADHWHTVETVQDSVSLNVSIEESFTWADALWPAIRTALLDRNGWASPEVGLWASDHQRQDAARMLSTLVAGLGDDLRGIDPDEVAAAWRAADGPAPSDATPQAFTRNRFVTCELMASGTTAETFRVRIESAVRPGSPRSVAFPWASYDAFLDLVASRGLRRADEFPEAALMVAELLRHGALRKVEEK